MVRYQQDHTYLLSRSSDGPYIVRVFEIVTGDLLLVAGAPPIRVLEWVEVLVGVEPAGDVSGPQGEGGAIAEYCVWAGVGVEERM